MQQAADLLLFGLVLKTHGIGGQMVLKLFLLPGEDIEKDEPVFVEIDGIPVPFFIREFRLISDDSAIIHLDEIDSSEEASGFVNCRVFADRNRIQPREEPRKTGYEELEGFRVIDDRHGDSGTLREIVEYTENILMIVDFENREILIPFHDSIIRDIDHSKRIIKILAPEGLFDLFS
jgi:16S rRNA processing protein RimM